VVCLDRRRRTPPSLRLAPATPRAAPLRNCISRASWRRGLLLAEPADGAREIAKLKKTDELVVIGVEKDGFIQVQAAAGSGWVKKVLVNKT
jgi:hypothetical protein